MKEHFKKQTKTTDITISVECVPKKLRKLNQFNGVVGIFICSDDPWEDAHLIAKKMKLKQTELGRRQEKRDK